MTILDEIAAEKRLQVERERKKIEALKIPAGRKKRSLTEAISKDGLSYILEIKKASPSLGEISGADPVEVAKIYEKSGAAAISVLTEEKHFSGSIKDLADVSSAVDISVLRKDFIIDEIQLRESLAYGADAVLLIVALLGDKTAEYILKASKLGLECLVEVHDEKELEIALQSGAEIIGINNRDLKTLKTDLSTFEKLAPKIKDVLIVAESGVKTRDDAERMRRAGADAILVGSSIMQSTDIAGKIRELMP